MAGLFAPKVFFYQLQVLVHFSLFVFSVSSFVRVTALESVTVVAVVTVVTVVVVVVVNM